MPTINGRACVANGRDLYLDSKKINDSFAAISNTKVTVEPFDSTTNMWHIVAEQGTSTCGIYFPGYADSKIPDNSDWSYSADAKGTGKIYMFGIERGSQDAPIGAVGSEWSRISQSGHIDSGTKTIVMYFDTDSSPVDIYIKLPKLEIGKFVTPLKIDKVFSNGKQVYGRNLLTGTSNAQDYTLSGSGWAAGSQASNGTNMSIPGTPGKNYTYSVNVKTTTFNCFPQISFYDSSKNLLAISNTIPGTGIGLRKATAVAPANTAFLTVSVLLQNPPDSQTVIFNSENLEQSSIATPWTPAPEDVM